jgi:hypothetical protein
VQLVSIQVFPIKALDGVDVEEASFRASGGLARDREWAIADARGRFVNGKSSVLVHAIRARFDLPGLTVRLSREGADPTGPLSLERDAPAIEGWLSEHLGQAVRLQRDSDRGFPDDRDRPGPTLACRASLEAVERWFGWGAGQARARFRVNLVIDGAPAFWEDRLAAAGATPFHVGAAELHGLNLCRRCVVPSRNPLTGVAIRKFHLAFRERREAELPPWAARERFEGEFYRFALNTAVPESARGARIRVGDPVA